MSRARSLAVLIGCIGACLLTGWLGSVFTAPAIDTWYQTLAKPAWTPASWVFAPVWTVLYVLMGTAAWAVWNRAGWKGGGAGLVLFSIQLVLNAAWSPLFFGLRRPDIALVDLVLLWVAIVATTVAFWKAAKSAGLLMVPYLLWVSFAGMLNLAIWRLNPR